MSASAFDALSVARDLEAAGIERRHAEAHAEALRQAVSADRDELATDELATTADIADLKADMLKVAIGVAIGIVIANATLTAVFIFGAMRPLQP